MSRKTAPGAKLPDAIERAIEEIRAHEAVVRVDKVDAGHDLVSVVATFQVPLPSRAKSRGASATGVKAEEPVTLIFDGAYPFTAPAIFLRADFPRNFAHINPTRAKDLVLPCVSDIPLSELMHEGLGLPRVLDEIAEWLASAAANTLIDPTQGWQPMRRDSIQGFATYSSKRLSKLLQTRAGSAIYRANVFSIGDTYDAKLVLETILSRFDFRTATKDQLSYFVTTAVVAWGAEKDSHGRLRVDDQYFPDTVENVDGLLALAALYDAREALQSGLNQCVTALQQTDEKQRPSHIVVVLCARRPYRVIGSDESIEGLPYIVAVDVLNGTLRGSARVDPLAHHEELTPEFLRRLSGGDPKRQAGPIVALGAGSLGSKLVVHLARAGFGPFTIVDRSYLSAHHLARHAATESLDHRIPSKAGELKAIIEALAPNSVAVEKDIKDVLASDAERARVIPKTAVLLIESTGSLAVRDYLASTPVKVLPRVAHAILYASGRAALLAVEGEKRDPRLDDLVAYFYHHTLSDPALAAVMYGANTALTRIAVGHGCGSYSMVLPDSRLSIAAGGIAERLRLLLEGSMPTTGFILIGQSDVRGLGYSWMEAPLGKTERILAEDQSGWHVRILRPAVVSMTEEVRKWGAKETGGGVIGQISMLKRTITITGLIPAPPDSKRSGSEFIMGTQGIRERAREISLASGDYITYLGTWHSHPLGGKPSTKDRRTFETIKELRQGVPGVVLVWTPHRFFGLVG